MNCDEAQLALLDLEVNSNVDAHVSTCDACRQFAQIQRELDARLTAAIPPLELSPKFAVQLRPHSRWTWSESLPDIAHLIGCAAAMGTLAFVFPQYAKEVATAGSALTAGTWFLQAILRDRLEPDG